MKALRTATLAVLLSVTLSSVAAFAQNESAIGDLWSWANTYVKCDRVSIGDSRT